MSFKSIFNILSLKKPTSHVFFCQDGTGANTLPNKRVTQEKNTQEPENRTSVAGQKGRTPAQPVQNSRRQNRQCLILWKTVLGGISQSQRVEKEAQIKLSN